MQNGWHFSCFMCINWMSTKSTKKKNKFSPANLVAFHTNRHRIPMGTNKGHLDRMVSICHRVCMDLDRIDLSCIRLKKKKNERSNYNLYKVHLFCKVRSKVSGQTSKWEKCNAKRMFESELLSEISIAVNGADPAKNSERNFRIFHSIEFINVIKAHSSVTP